MWHLKRIFVFCKVFQLIMTSVKNGHSVVIKNYKPLA